MPKFPQYGSEVLPVPIEQRHYEFTSLELARLNREVEAADESIKAAKLAKKNAEDLIKEYNKRMREKEWPQEVPIEHHLVGQQVVTVRTDTNIQIRSRPAKDDELQSEFDYSTSRRTN